jgi:transcriptional regulator with XRE-family HTH domain
VAKKPNDVEIRKLLSRVFSVTLRHGSKSRLARFLGITPQHLNAWLSRNKSPGGESALRMLKWVEREEKRMIDEARETAHYSQAEIFEYIQKQRLLERGRPMVGRPHLNK